MHHCVSVVSAKFLDMRYKFDLHRLTADVATEMGYVSH